MFFFNCLRYRSRVPEDLGGEMVPKLVHFVLEVGAPKLKSQGTLTSRDQEGKNI